MDNNSKKKILLVDDDDMLRGIYAAKLASEGFDVIPVRNGREAWDIISGGNVPDVVFTGINMPEIGGFELIGKIKSTPGLVNMPTAISSHRGLPEDQKKARDLGVDDFIIQSETKPGEVVRRMKLILGIQDVLQIAFSPEHFDGKSLMDLLNRQQGTYVTPRDGREAILELKPEKEPGLFRVKLVDLS